MIDKEQIAIEDADRIIKNACVCGKMISIYASPLQVLCHSAHG